MLSINPALAVTGLNRQKGESTVCHLYELSHLRPDYRCGDRGGLALG